MLRLRGVLRGGLQGLLRQLGHDCRGWPESLSPAGRRAHTVVHLRNVLLGVVVGEDRLVRLGDDLVDDPAHRLGPLALLRLLGELRPLGRL